MNKQEEFKRKRKKREKYRIHIKGINYENNLDDSVVIGCYKKFPDIKISSKISELGANEKISCMRDLPFKTLIVNSRKPERMARFLETIIDAPYDKILHDLRFIATEFNMETLNSKNYRGDCAVAVGNNAFLIEVNRTWAEERNLKYLDSCFSIPLLLGGEEIGPSSVTLVNINYYKYEGHEESVEMYLPINENGELLTFCKLIINIFVPIIIEKYYNGDELSDLERIVLIFVLTNMDRAKEIARGDEIMLDFIEDSKLLENDERFVASYNKELEKDDYPMVEIYDEGREEGREEGEQIGIEKGEQIGIEKGIAILKMFQNGTKLEEISNTMKIPVSKIKRYLEII